MHVLHCILLSELKGSSDIIYSATSVPAANQYSCTFLTLAKRELVAFMSPFYAYTAVLVLPPCSCCTAYVCWFDVMLFSVVESRRGRYNLFVEAAV